MNPNTTSIFLIISALLLGIAIGGIIANLLQEKKTGGQAEKSEFKDLLRLRKDSGENRLEVWVGEQAFHTVSEMDPVHRNLMSYLLDDLQAWLSGKAPLEPSETGPSPEKGISLPVSGAEIPSVTGTQEMTAKPEATLNPSVASDSETSSNDEAMAESSGKPKQPSVLNTIVRALRSEGMTNRLASISIASQVNEILQNKIKDTPLEKLGISLMEKPEKDMVVMIGMDQYDSISDVPDAEIRTVLQSAVNDWLAKKTA